MNFSNQDVGGMVIVLTNWEKFTMKLGTKIRDWSFQPTCYVISTMASLYTLQALYAYAIGQNLNAVINTVTGVIWLGLLPIVSRMLKILAKTKASNKEVSEQIEAYRNAERTTFQELLRIAGACPMCYKQVRDLIEIRDNETE